MTRTAGARSVTLGLLLAATRAHADARPVDEWAVLSGVSSVNNTLFAGLLTIGIATGGLRSSRRIGMRTLFRF